MLTVTRADGATATAVVGGRLLSFVAGVARVPGALLPRVERAAVDAGYVIGLEPLDDVDDVDDQADELAVVTTPDGAEHVGLLPVSAALEPPAPPVLPVS